MKKLLAMLCKVVVMSYFITTTFRLFAGKPGDLDFAFNRPTGYRLTEVPDSTAGGAAGVALQSDGKIVIAGLSNFEFGAGHVFLARYNTDGSLDTSFGTNGTINQNFADQSGAMAIAIQTDDKIVIAGYATLANKPRFLVARFTKDGVLDTTTFNVADTPGYRLTLTEFNAAASNAAAWKVGLQSDGTIIASGYYWVTGDNYRKIAVAQYNTNGTFKTSTIATAANHSIMAAGMAIGSNDYITIGGFYEVSSSQSYFLVIRLKNDGSADTNFGTGGSVTTNISNACDMALAIVLQSDGKTVAIGQYGGSDVASFDGDVALVRYTSTGALDTSFGSYSGIAVTNVLTYSTALAGLIDSSGNIITGGFARMTGFDAKLLLLRYTNAGILDTTFGVNGVTLTDTPTNGELLRSLAFQSDGKIVAAGGGIYFGGSGPVAVMRDPIYRDGSSTQGYAIVGRYLNQTTTLSTTQRTRAQQLAGQWGLSPWFNSAVQFFNLMQLKGNDFGVTHVRPISICKETCTHCS